MTLPPSSSAADAADGHGKLMTPLSAILVQRRADLVPLLKGQSGALTHAALRDDDAVRRVAAYCYGMPPWALRLVVKEPAFVHFVMTNREKVLAQLLTP